MMGFSLGEFLCAFLVVGVLAALFVGTAPAIGARAAQVENFGLTLATREYWVETWANDGIRAPAESPGYFREADGKYGAASDLNVADGAVSFISKAAARSLDGGVVTFRPAFSAADAPFSILWVCGNAPVPQGFTVRGENHTSLADAQLLSRCRRPLT